MATYTELHSLRNDSALRNRVMVACIVSAEAIMVEDGGTPNNANRRIWAASVFASPIAEANRMYMAVLAANKDLAISAIQGASDAQIQTNVDDHIDLFATES